ncbi:FecR domain-containing protein, partial [Thermodesulfobacteriota bacterium]
MDNKKKICTAIFFICMVILSMKAWAGPPRVGIVIFTCGVVTAGPEDGELRFLGKGEPLYQGDVITTGVKSYAIIRMIDESKITLRPDTVFAVEEYKIEKGKENALLRLFRGGIRAVTGFIAKRNPKRGYNLHTPTAVVGVRGTEFDARLCEGDCATDDDNIKSRERESRLPVVGRVTHLKGRLTARVLDKTERLILKGGPVYEGDTLETGPESYAVVVFRDNSRVSLQSKSVFKVEQYQFRSGARNNVLFRLFRGGLRVFSGLIARRNARAFKLGTPTAVVGVRGTGFDVYHRDNEVIEEQVSSLPERNILKRLLTNFPRQAMAETPKEYGTTFHVWDGAIELIRDIEGVSTGMVLEKGQTAFWPKGATDAIRLPTIPDYMRDLVILTPRPDELKIDIQLEFGTEEKSKIPPGLYVTAYKGHLEITTSIASIHIGGGEAVHVSSLNEMPVRLEQIPLFQEQDRFPRP